jgi:hypothetical protein
MGFFKNLNLARGAVIASVLGSLVLGWLCWLQKAELETLQAAASKQQIEKDMRQLMSLGHEHTQLRNALKSRSGSGADDIQSYVRRQATTKDVDIGNVEISKESKPIKGVVDDVYRITFRDKDRSFDRVRLTNFLYKLEEGSPRLKITNITLQVAEKNLKPHEVPSDTWSLDTSLMVRQRAP